jgi:hypothetical protein
MLFNESRTRTDVQFKLYISYLELYNETGYDLLDPSHETKALEDLPKVSMLEDEHGECVVCCGVVCCVVLLVLFKCCIVVATAYSMRVVVAS